MNVYIVNHILLAALQTELTTVVYVRGTIQNGVCAHHCFRAHLQHAHDCHSAGG